MLDAYRQRALLHGINSDIPAMAYYQNKEYQNALVSLDKAIELDPSNEDSQKYRTQAQATYIASQPMTTPVITAQVEPTIIPTLQPTITPIPTPIQTVTSPTSVPTYEICACGGDYYDCDTFSGPSHAQGCYDYCISQGAGDIHQMDRDGDGLACISSVTNSVTSTSIATTTPIPVMSTPSPTPTATLEVVSWIATSQAEKAASCYCASDAYNCDTFIYQSSAQICYDECIRRVGSDVHELDGDGDGRVCEWLR